MQVLGDVVVEADETFFMNLSGPINATLGDAQGVGTIGDDDAASLSSNELNHGSVQQADLEVRPDLYRIGQKPHSSYEVVIDGTSGDIVPVTLERLAGDNLTVLQSAAPVAVGGQREPALGEHDLAHRREPARAGGRRVRHALRARTTCTASGPSRRPTPSRASTTRVAR